MLPSRGISLFIASGGPRHSGQALSHLLRSVLGYRQHLKSPGPGPASSSCLICQATYPRGRQLPQVPTAARQSILFPSSPPLPSWPSPGLSFRIRHPSPTESSSSTSTFHTSSVCLRLPSPRHLATGTFVSWPFVLLSGPETCWKLSECGIAAPNAVCSPPPPSEAQPDSCHALIEDGPHVSCQHHRTTCAEIRLP